MRFEFKSNEWFDGVVLEKKFWYRRSLTGWAGLVSEPVPIKWKKGKDLTEGLLDATMKAWEAQKKAGTLEWKGVKTKNGRENKREYLQEEKELKEILDDTCQGAVSFFTFFGFRGKWVGAEENAEVLRREKEMRERKMRVNAGKEAENGEDGDEDDNEDENEDEYEDDEDFETSLEIFPSGEEVSVAISEDLWPGAIRYFSMSRARPCFFFFATF
jgi:hypothetical protein